MGPVLDALDESEWDDHFEVRGLIDKWRDLKKSLDVLRAELKQFRKNKEEEIAKAVAEKMREFEEVLNKEIYVLLTWTDGKHVTNFIFIRSNDKC